MVVRLTLTPREADILPLLVQGHTARQVARILYLSPDTVREYVARIYQKLGVHSRAACVWEAMQQGLVPVPAAPERQRA